VPGAGFGQPRVRYAPALYKEPEVMGQMGHHYSSSRVLLCAVLLAARRAMTLGGDDHPPGWVKRFAASVICDEE
jgi:hypothetical protein